MNGHLEGQVALVTGGSGGIGRAICHELASRGARVWVHYHRGEEKAAATLDGLDGGPHASVGADLRDPEAVRAAIDRVAGESGRLDVLVNNAGIYEPHPPARVDYRSWQEHWQRTLGVNLVAAANACWCAAQHMIRGDGGRIVNITSRGAFRGEPDTPAYGASKAGLNARAQSRAMALAPQRIFVYAVAPGFVETAMARPHLNSEMGDAIRRQSPLGRVATVADVAYWVGCLADPRAEFATGAIIDVNGASYLRT